MRELDTGVRSERMEALTEWVDRYERRGSPKEFVELLDKMWDQWIKEMDAETRCAERVVLPPLHYLGDHF